jgi:hypothetical protein
MPGSVRWHSRGERLADARILSVVMVKIGLSPSLVSS